MNPDIKAMIFDIQRNSYVDGPGIRTTVFFKGCPLRCAWCHNPEGIASESQTMSVKGVPTPCGKKYTVNEIWEEIAKDRLFYQTSGGGVTFSGGECMLQIDFLEEILKKCKRNGIHTAVDTAGCVPYESFSRILPYTDLLLYDVKCFDAARHKRYTGVDNALIFSNLQRLLRENHPLWVRIPIIPGVNDTVAEMQDVKRFLNTYGTPQRVELLPYHTMGEHKYTALGLPPPPFFAPSENVMRVLREILEAS